MNLGIPHLGYFVLLCPFVPLLLLIGLWAIRTVNATLLDPDWQRGEEEDERPLPNPRRSTHFRKSEDR
ncbi:MAG: hypothetical protein K2W96_22785 [Gemmataceae bacterium]|nr:hypothetical protein [Gemmataceae bacterium]